MIFETTELYFVIKIDKEFQLFFKPIKRLIFKEKLIKIIIFLFFQVKKIDFIPEYCK